MIYPAVVLSFATLVLIFMLMFIVPVFQKVFDQLNGQFAGPDSGHHRHVARPSRLLVHHLPDDRVGRLFAASVQALGGRSEGLGSVRAAPADEDRRCACRRWRSPRSRARSRRSSQPASTSSAHSTSPPARPGAAGCSKSRWTTLRTRVGRGLPIGAFRCMEDDIFPPDGVAAGWRGVRRRGPE